MALVLSLASANLAAAAPPPPQPCADEDVAAIHQYCELLADAGGILAPGSSRETLAEALPPATIKRLEKAGPQGLALLSLPAESVRPDRRSESFKPLEARMDEL